MYIYRVYFLKFYSLVYFLELHLQISNAMHLKVLRIAIRIICTYLPGHYHFDNENGNLICTTFCRQMYVLMCLLFLKPILLTAKTFEYM